MARYRDEDEDDRDDRPSRKPRDDDRDNDDDRPQRRSRRDDDDDRDDRPRRRSSRDDDGGSSGSKKLNVCGLIALIVSIPSILVTIILGCCHGWIPGSIGGLISVVLGVIGLVLAKKSEGQMGGGLAIAGTILGAITLVFSIMWGLFFAAMLGMAATQSSNPAQSLSNPADVTITAVQLDNEYNQNVAAADAKYKGKIIEVTGVVERVSDEVKKFRLTVELTGAIGSTVDCDFSTSDKAALSNLTPGTTVTIRGKCIGRRTVDGDKWVTLEKCVVVPPESKTDTKPTGTKGAGATPTGPKPGAGALKVTAADLAKAYTDDEDSADAKYKGKVLEVTGKVYRNKLYVQPENPAVCLGQKDLKLEVECRVSEKVKSDLALVNLGDAITFRGKCAGKDEDLVILENCTPVK